MGMMKPLYTYTSHVGLIFLFIVFGLFIMVQSLYDPDGFLTSDSAHYLQMAENLLAGNGMTTPNYVPGMSTYFATWPVGYPVLIAIVSLLTGLGVFWSSKLVNIIVFGFCLLLIKRLFKQRAPIIAMVFFLSTFSTIFVYTWSEVPFLLGMLWLVYGLTRYIETNRIYYAMQLLLAAVLMFFMRYIGLIGAGIIGLLGFYYLFRKQWKNMITCWVAGGIPLLIAGVYLLLNYRGTGFPTGMERIPKTETTTEFLTMLWQAVIAEFNMLATTSDIYGILSTVIIIIGFILFIRPKHVKRLFLMDRKQFLVPGLFLLTGAIYFIAIVYMRWTAYFDPFNFRLLSPATFMTGLAIMSWISQVTSQDWKHWRRFVIFILGVAFMMNIGYKTYAAISSSDPNYMGTRTQIQKMYEEIPAGSIIAFENFHARYLRPDLQYIKVYFRPYFAENESVDDFLERITPNQAAGVFFENGAIIRKNQYHDSFDRLAVQAAKGADFIKMED